MTNPQDFHLTDRVRNLRSIFHLPATYDIHQFFQMPGRSQYQTGAVLHTTRKSGSQAHLYPEVLRCDLFHWGSNFNGEYPWGVIAGQCTLSGDPISPTAGQDTIGFMYAADGPLIIELGSQVFGPGALDFEHNYEVSGWSVAAANDDYEFTLRFFAWTTWR